MNLEIRDLQKADIFVQCFQHIKTFTETINIVFEPEQMYIQCMDSTMVLIMEFKLPSSWFDVYEVEQSITIGLLTNTWTKVLLVRDKSQHIRLTTHERQDYVSVYFHVDDSKLVFDKSFEIPMIELDTELLHIPDMEYSAEFTLPSNTLSSMVQQLKQFGDVMHIECTEEHIQIIADSQEFGKMNTSIPIDDLDEYAIDEGGKVSSSFGLRMIHNVCMFQKVAKSVQLGLSDNFPMKLNFQMDADASLVFFIAPRMDDA